MNSEDIILYITIISFIIPIIGTIVKPHEYQVNAGKDARDRGWSPTLIIFTRSFCFLTLYTQFLIILALIYKTPRLLFIAHSFSIYVFLLYHGMNAYDKMLLPYHPRERVEEVVRCLPPLNKNIVIWFGLHLQHSFYPVYLYYLKGDVEYNAEDFIYNIFLMVIYILWHLFCWKVQNIPAYPFLIRLRAAELELEFYILSLSAIYFLHFFNFIF